MSCTREGRAERGAVAGSAAVIEAMERRCLLSAALLPNQPITTDPAVQQQPSIAVDQNAPSRLAIVYLDYGLTNSGYAGIGVSVSGDGGATWTESSIDLPAGFDQGAANPIARFDDQGRLFVSFAAATFLGKQPRLTDPNGVDADGNQVRTYGMTANNGIFVVRSDDGGQTWAPPVAVASHLYNGSDKVPFDIKPDLAIDTFATLPDGGRNPNYGNLYAVWTRYYPSGQYPGEPGSLGGSNILIAVSHDGGDTWQLQLEEQPDESPDPVTVIFNKGTFTGTAITEGLGLDNWSHVSIGPDGDVYVSQFLGGPFVVHHSTDGAKSFAHPDQATGSGYPFRVNNSVVPGPLSNNSFRLQSVRAIAADPTRPGTVYVAEAEQTNSAQGGIADEGEIIFARSTDFGATWKSRFELNGATDARVVNDDNAGQTATGLPGDVADVQALPRLVTGPDGTIMLIWYDTRRDPAAHLLDVFGAISTDGGLTFGPNFRITDRSFDADAGAFTDATGATNFYLGDFVGLTLTRDTAYASWTDTRNGNQDIVLSSFPIAPAPAAPNDRFEPNDDSAAVTALGSFVQRVVPRLDIGPGDVDVFSFTSLATGTLDLLAAQSSPGAHLSLELLDGGTVVATGEDVADVAGQVTGQRITFPSVAGHSYTLRVTSGDGVATAYALDLQGLTGDFGTVAQGQIDGELATGDEAYYRVTAAAAGSVRVNLSPSADLVGTATLELIDPDTLAPSASGSTGGEPTTATVTVERGEQLLIRVAAAEGAVATGSFSLDVTNFDQFATADNKQLFFPTGAGPSEAAVADLNGDAKPDVVVSNVGENVISVMLNGGDGTFQAPREFAVGAFQQGGPFTLQGVPNFHRDLRIADLNADAIPDVVVGNASSSDVSVLLGRGDGTFEPQRRYDATAAPFALDVGDVNNDGIPDLAVVDSTAGPAVAGVLLGRGDGSFRPLQPFEITPGEPFRTNAIVIADLDDDGNNDLVVRDFVDGTMVLRGNGDGTFLAPEAAQPISGPGLTVGDLNADGSLDIVTTQNNTSMVAYSLGNGDGTFQDTQTTFAGQFPVAAAVADVGSVEDGESVLGPPDGRADLIVANNGRALPTVSGPPELVVLPGLVDGQGEFAGFGDPIRIASPQGPLDVKVADINADGAPDILTVDRTGLLVVYGEQPVIATNDTRQTARDLGIVVHLLQPTLTITPSRADNWYSLTVPTEAARGSRDEILDFSALFDHQRGAGLEMEILDERGRVRGTGENVRVRAKQGQQLFVHVFGKTDPATGQRGSGAYTLDVAVLPQLVAVDAPPLLPGSRPGRAGGPTATLVLTFQGDRLDPEQAENPANYRVIRLNGNQEIPVVAGAGAQAAVYNASSNVDVGTGKQFPTAVRQTVTLLFDKPLPAGSYRVSVAPAVRAAAFNGSEAALIGDRHSIASISTRGKIVPGATITGRGIVRPVSALGELDVFESGTSFLSQLHGDLGALLDRDLSALGDSATITPMLLAQMLARLQPGVGNATSVLALFLDPLSLDVEDPTGAHVRYDLNSGDLSNQIANAFVSVASNVELVIIPLAAGQFTLNVADVPATARGGAVILDGSGGGASGPISFTDRLRAGERTFEFNVQSVAGPTPSQQPTGDGGNGLSVDPTAALAAADVVSSGTSALTAAFMFSNNSIVSSGAPAVAARPAVAAPAAASNPIVQATGGAGGSDPKRGPGPDGARRGLLDVLKEYADTLRDVFQGSVAPQPRANQRDERDGDKDRNEPAAGRRTSSGHQTRRPPDGTAVTAAPSTLAEPPDAAPLHHSSAPPPAKSLFPMPGPQSGAWQSIPDNGAAMFYATSAPGSVVGRNHAVCPPPHPRRSRRSRP